MDKATNGELTAMALLVDRIAGNSPKHTPHGWNNEEERDIYTATVLRFICRLRGAENAAGLTLREVVDHAEAFARKAVEDMKREEYA